MQRPGSVKEATNDACPDLDDAASRVVVRHRRGARPEQSHLHSRQQRCPHLSRDRFAPFAELQTATFIAGSEPTGLTLAQAVALEVATAPLGSSSGGFIYSFDPATRGHRRTSSTFGPAFAERALTIGKGKISGGLNFLHRSYDEFGGLDLSQFDVFSFQGGRTLAVRSAEMELDIETDTTAVFGHFGLLDNLDVGILVP